MGKIKVLPNNLANQVAAGEVVERPASLVKELVENSIDAGATRITVEFSKGGAKCVRVSDNGGGMDKEDARLCLERHATSKLQRVEELASIKTLGFRGEALPSIASVSRFRLTTKRKEDEVGTRVVVEGGEILEIVEEGAVDGTTVEVRDLFYNVPARRKFLRSEVTESAQILSHIQALAMAHPEIAFVCKKNDKEVMRYPIVNGREERLRDIHGQEFLDRMVALEPKNNGGVGVSGWIGRAGEGRIDRGHQFFFVNGRCIRSPFLSAPLREAADGFMQKGMAPPAVLFLSMEDGMVDCNVHPGKMEVRFKNPTLVRTMMFMAARSAWVARGVDEPGALVERGGGERGEVFLPAAVEWPTVVERELFPETGVENPPAALEFFGILDGKYLIFGEGGAATFLEIRGAMERVIFDKLTEKNLQTAQPLLVPVTVSMSPAECEWVLSRVHDFDKIGMGIEAFGDGTIKIDSLPACLSDMDPRELLYSVTKGILEEHNSGAVLLEDITKRVSRVAARVGRIPEGREGAMFLLKELLGTNMPYVSPGGRPTMVQLSPGELERKFRC